MCLGGAEIAAQKCIFAAAPPRLGTPAPLARVAGEMEGRPSSPSVKPWAPVWPAREIGGVPGGGLPPYPRNPPVLLGGVHSAGRVRFISMPISPWRRSLRALEVKTGNSFRERKRREARWASRGRCACLQVLDARKNGSGDTHPVITISNVVISAESFL